MLNENPKSPTINFTLEEFEKLGNLSSAFAALCLV